MNKYLTGNSLGSTSPKDLYDNASNFDEGMNSPGPAFIDRFGDRRETWKGFEVRVAAALVSLGYVYTTPLDYQAGITLTGPNQVFRRDGEYFRAGPSVTFPYTLTGDWATEGPLFVSTGDAALRSALAASTGAQLVGYGTSTVAQTITNLSALALPVFPGDDVPAAIAKVKAQGGGVVGLLPGTHYPTSTWVLDSSVELRGAGGTKTVVYRNAAYGDTIYQETGFARISGIFFMHGTLDAAGSTALDFRLTDGSAHIHLKNTQDSLVRDCIVWRMPYGMISDGGINTRVENCWFMGVWDKQVPAKQEGLADIYWTGTTQHGQLAKVLNCYMSGAAGPTRPTTYTDGATSVTVDRVSNIGAQSNMLIDSLEDMDISGTYFGRSAYSLLHFTPNNITADVRVNHCFFDNAGDGADSRQILVDALLPNRSILGMSVTACTFNGEYDTNNALVVAGSVTDGSPTVINLAFTGNTLFAHTGTPVVLFGVGAGNVTGNTITNWNSVGAALPSSTSATSAAPVYVGPRSYGVNVQGNTLGGGGNLADDSSNKCYMPVVIDPAAVACNSGPNLYIGISNGTIIRKGLSTGERLALHTTGGNFALKAGLSTYIRNFTTSATNLVALPERPIVGSEAIIKDGKGDAATNTLVISTTDGTMIDGAGNMNIVENFGYRRLLFDGIMWRRIG